MTQKLIGPPDSRSIALKELFIAAWSIAWAGVMTLTTNGGNAGSILVALIWFFFHAVGLAYLARPLRTISETLLLAAVGALTFALARLAFLALAGLVFDSVVIFGWFVIVAAVFYWLILIAILLPGRWVVKRLTTMPYLGNCLGCGYDLRGNDSGTCSECGEAIPTDQLRYLSKLKAEAP